VKNKNILVITLVFSLVVVLSVFLYLGLRNTGNGSAKDTSTRQINNSTGEGSEGGEGVNGGEEIDDTSDLFDTEDPFEDTCSAGGGFSGYTICN
jgi:hypothetical protein